MTRFLLAPILLLFMACGEPPEPALSRERACQYEFNDCLLGPYNAGGWSWIAGYYECRSGLAECVGNHDFIVNAVACVEIATSITATVSTSSVVR